MLKKKPKWLHIKTPNINSNYFKIKKTINSFKIKTVCEEANCPNIVKCFENKTATFIILGNICTRNCPFCNIQSGNPNQIDINEPNNIAKLIYKLKLKYVVLTSVNRDDLIDGGALHFVECIKKIKKISPNIFIEILIPDFIFQFNTSIKILNKCLPNVINHNIETVPRLYKKIKPKSNYKHSLKLLNYFKSINNKVITKSGIMVGLGETKEEIISVMNDLKNNHVDIITIGQYLQPSKQNIKVKKYIEKETYQYYKKQAKKLKFKKYIIGPMIRSSYNAKKIYINIKKNNIYI